MRSRGVKNIEGALLKKFDAFIYDSNNFYVQKFFQF